MNARRFPVGRLTLGALALVAVARVGSRGPAAPTVSDETRASLASESARVASRAAVAAPGAPLAGKAPSTDRDPGARVARLVACVHGLARARGAEAALDPAVASIARAAASLGRPGLSALVGVVEDGGEPAAARALACGILECVRETDSTAVVALVMASGKSEPLVLRRAAARALAICAPGDVRLRLLDLSRDPDALVQLEALVGLARAGDRDALRILEDAASAEGPGFARAAALAALRSVGRDESRAALERCRERVSAEARPIVSLVLAERGSRAPEVEADVREAARDTRHPARCQLARELIAARR